MTESCISCKFYQRVHAVDWVKYGSCRRHAPIISEIHITTGNPSSSSATFPTVQNDTWCGDWTMNQHNARAEHE